MATHSSILVQYPMDRGAWRAAVPGVAMTRTRLKRLSTAQSGLTTLDASHKALKTNKLSGGTGRNRIY